MPKEKIIDELMEFSRGNKNSLASIPHTIKKTQGDLPIEESKILELAKKQITLSRNYVEAKREVIRDRYALLNTQMKKKGKINDNLIYDIIDTSLSIFYYDNISVVFKGRKTGDSRNANVINNVAKFDYEEMEMDITDYLVQFDRLFMGVGIKCINGWDKDRAVPIVEYLDTLSWLPDPFGHTDVKNFRWHGFEVEYTKSKMLEEGSGFFNIDKLEFEAAKKDRSSNQEKSRQARNDNSLLNDVNFNDVGDDKVFDCVDLFTSIQGDDGIFRKYIITVDNDCTTLVRCEELEAITTEEKNNPNLVPFPLTLHYYSPRRGDPYGTSVPDIAEDKQKARSLLKNLRIAFRKSVLYPMYLYDVEMVKNKRDLNFGYNKFIPVRSKSGVSVSSAVVPMNKAIGYQGETMNDEESLQQDAQRSTGTTNIVQGMAQTGVTATSDQQAQANANLRFLLKIKINNWGEKRFWFLWYRMYKAYFADNSKKVIELQSTFGEKFLTVKRKDFITKQDPGIEIVSKLDADKRNEQLKADFSAIYPLISNDPTKPLVSRRFAERKLMSLFSVPEDEISILSPATIDEIRARNENELLSRGEKVEVDVENEDHLTHLLVHSECEKTPQLLAHIAATNLAYYSSGQAMRDMNLFKQQQAEAPIPEVGSKPQGQNSGVSPKNVISAASTAMSAQM
jgi:hypothetical protein